MAANFSARVWWRACRPKTLPASLAPVALGTACAAAAGGFAPWVAALALLFALLVQITCNLANDYADFARGADTPERLGPERAVAAGAVAPRTMRRAAAVAAVAAFFAGFPLALRGDWWLAGVGVVCLLAAFAYTDGPFPLAYKGLGDVFVLVFFGFVAVLFTARVQCGIFPPSAWLAGLSCGLLAVNILVVNNARDMETDARAGKRTTAVRFGRGFARSEYVLNLGAALLAPVVLAVAFGFGAAVLLPLALAPVAVLLARAFLRVQNPVEYNPLLGKTAAFLLAHSLLFALGIAAGSP